MTTPTSVIVVDGVSKRFIIRRDKSLKERAIHAVRRGRTSEEFWALRDIDLEVAAGSTVGLVGHNGSGKSTLLKLVGGILRPTTGTVAHRGRVAALLELGAGFHPDLSGRENVYLNASLLGLSKKQTDGYFDEIVDFSGIEPFIDSQVKFYSSGMYVRLAFAVAVHVDPEVLLIDEVLAVGDEPFQRKCMDRIRQFQSEGRTIVLVSHSASQVHDLCDRVVVLDGGHMLFNGATDAGLHVLHRGYEEAMRLEEEAADTPRPMATVGPVRLLDARGLSRSSLTAGDEVTIEVTFVARETLRGWRGAVTIENGQGQVVYGANTHRSGLAMPDLDRDAKVTFHIPRLDLVKGTYSISAILESFEGIPVDVRAHAVTFDVESDGAATGIVDLRAAVQVERAESRA